MSNPVDPARTAPEQEGPPSDPAAQAPAGDHPSHIGRYRIERLLGEGGFGRVYLAYDEQLQRCVAVKVPHRQLVARPENADAYLTEARTVANLDHPHIVPVYDVGSIADCPCFIVSKFIEGRTLAWKIRNDRPAFAEATALVATVAEGLHHAHRKGVVHRDIKPGNILLDAQGTPYVADFGLALREESLGRGSKYAGTPAYMSPEQARGEGHRVDGRSDIFSLGVVFYELLTGRQPFRADSREELLEQITTFEPRPPRQVDDAIPKELERICLKALAKRASERFTTAKDLAEDLRHFLAEETVNPPSAPVSKSGSSPAPQPVVPSPAPSVASGSSGTPSTTPATPTSDSQPVKIVPKGLRSFDAQDADFFLELLPGPRDREGLPDSIRFWKTRIEESDPDNTFSVGLIYGPSGCGKSSLVKAGLLPRLSENVIAVYLEATAHETEPRLLNGLRKRCPALPVHLGLKETLAALRRGQGIPVGKKVLIVLDQFEQWLHAKKEEQNTELVGALRQCDGGRVQGMVLVRDDFWLAATRFMLELEIDLLQGQNTALADLFDLDHAKKVLAAFGRAFGRLPESAAATSREHKEFLSQAVSGLARDNKVVCVRLALFAEMMKGRPWTPATLKAVGGTEGVGVTFLEETFSSQTANPKHRLHQKAARAVLKVLLPESGTDIKGQMQSHEQLLEASGYGHRPRDFEALVHLLDAELRLITPTDPESKEGDGHSPPEIPLGQRYYQLTHDYLVPALRDWLTRKQKETRRGRAKLRLAERAAVWTAKPENRQLPAWWEWANIRLFTQKRAWTPAQRKMMRKATHYHTLRVGALLVLLALLGWGLWEGIGSLRARALVRTLAAAETTDVPRIIEELSLYRYWADPLLRQLVAEAEDDSKERLHAGLALLPADAAQVDYLYGRLLRATPDELPILRKALGGHAIEITERLWTLLEDSKADPRQRFRAAAALASYDPDSPRWPAGRAAVVDHLVAANSLHLGKWTEALRPVRKLLLAPLGEIFRDGKRGESERIVAANLLADYAADQPDLLAELIQDADDRQYAVLWPRLQEHRARAATLLSQALEKTPAAEASEEAQDALAKRQAQAAVALLQLGRPEKVWPLLQHRPDPRPRTYLIHRLSPLGTDPQTLIQRLEEEGEVSIRRALLLCLGEFEEDKVSAAARQPLAAKLLQLYRHDPDPGIHGAADWLLRRWHYEAAVQQLDNELAGQPAGQRHWYVNRHGQTLVLLPGPVEFLMGSPEHEPERVSAELLHRRRIERSFAIATKEVTVRQFKEFLRANPGVGHYYTVRRSPDDDGPIISVTWFEAVQYCRWLSEQEEVAPEEMCYPPITDIKEGMKPIPGYLAKTGYRLPTEAEWENACRAGATTSHAYGASAELLGNYAWYHLNAQGRAWPVGRLKPNDLGLFDMHGNAWEWTQDRSLAYGAGAQGGRVIEDKEDMTTILDPYSRALRGGGFNDPASALRSACRLPNRPSNRLSPIGLRLARTYR